MLVWVEGKAGGTHDLVPTLKSSHTNRRSNSTDDRAGGQEETAQSAEGSRSWER